jgi:hypothetical protein
MFEGDLQNVTAKCFHMHVIYYSLFLSLAHATRTYQCLYFCSHLEILFYNLTPNFKPLYFLSECHTCSLPHSTHSGKISFYLIWNLALCSDSLCQIPDTFVSLHLIFH